MTEKSHIQKVRERYASNQQFILMATGLTECEYNTIMFNQAMVFIDLEYPRKTQFEQCRSMIYGDRQFWNWWIAIWKKHEDDFVQFAKDFKAQFSAKFYTEEMEQITHESTTTNLFYQQYQKPIYESAKKHWRSAQKVTA